MQATVPSILAPRVSEQSGTPAQWNHPPPVPITCGLRTLHGIGLPRASLQVCVSERVCEYECVCVCLKIQYNYYDVYSVIANLPTPACTCVCCECNCNLHTFRIWFEVEWICVKYTIWLTLAITFQTRGERDISLGGVGAKHLVELKLV